MKSKPRGATPDDELAIRAAIEEIAKENRDPNAYGSNLDYQKWQRQDFERRKRHRK